MKRMSVLLVDNSSGVRRELESVIAENCSFEVTISVESPEAALDISRSISPDLVIYDLPLTGSSDAGAIRELKASLPHTSIIVISLYDNYRNTALKAGADEFVSKTAPRGTLLEAIARLCPSDATASRI